VLGIPDQSICVPIPSECIGSCGVPGQVLGCVLLIVQCWPWSRTALCYNSTLGYN